MVRGIPISKNEPPFDISQLQIDLERTLQETPPIEYAQQRIRDHAPTSGGTQWIGDKIIENEHHTKPPQVNYDDAPAYLPPTDNVSAIAVASQYEAAAKQVEQMGAELKEAAKRAEAMAAKVTDALKFIEDTAATYRAEAALIFERIEKVDKLSEAVITACEEMKQRITE